MPSERRRRRRYSEEFKAEVVVACNGTEVAITAIALAHRLNANLLRRWIDQAEGRLPKGMSAPPTDLQPAAVPAFVPICSGTPEHTLGRNSCRSAPGRSGGHGKLADIGDSAVCSLAAMIRVNEISLAVDPLDMHAGFDTALARVVIFAQLSEAPQKSIFAEAIVDDRFKVSARTTNPPCRDSGLRKCSMR
jgi:hypothetical protein